MANRTITGTVTDRVGEALVGVSIAIDGTSRGTTTDLYGHYSLQVTSHKTSLTFSYAGFKTKHIVVGTDNVVNIVLEAAP